jgi:hypothetical protein
MLEILGRPLPSWCFTLASRSVAEARSPRMMRERIAFSSESITVSRRTPAVDSAALRAR